ncbi:phBC6A51 family helix-turn-helix protein [Bacillus smithii]|uniref:phBC6A51 family helix-turn-helix protein n=1 Tax=Bacillus smithii TaxID=1479 RepID=UPI003D240274
MATLEELRSQLTDTQAKAAYLLFQNSFANRDEKKTLEEIAHECGVSRMQLYNWRQDIDFIRYKKALSERHLAFHRDFVDSQLMKLIKGTSNNGIPSIKALALYYKLCGDLVDKKSIEFEDVSRRPRLTEKEISEGLNELNAMLDEGNN